MERAIRDVSTIAVYDQLEHAKENMCVFFFIFLFSLIGQNIFLKVYRYAHFLTMVKYMIFKTNAKTQHIVLTNMLQMLKQK